MTIQEAVRTATEQCKDPAAQTYLHAIDIAMDEYGSEGLRVQLLYCLNNMQGWRGEVARNVKKVFREHSKKR